MKRQLVVIMLATIFLFIERSACAEIQYTLTDLGTLGGATSSYATDINASGQVVGSSGWYAFLYSDGVMTNLGTLDGCTDSSASAINASGQVVGDGTTNRDAHLPFSWTAFLYSGGTMTNLGTLGGQYSFAYDINASGQVVGEAYRSSGGGGAFLYSDGLMTDLGPGEACGINDSGQVVGKGNYHAFLYSSGTITDLGTLGGSSSTGLAINASGQVVGVADTTDDTSHSHAFLYSNGTMTDLGTLGGDGSIARDINASGQIVGASPITSSPAATCHAFIYNSGMITDLNDLIDPASGWRLISAEAINDSGQIVGYGYNSALGQQHAFLLTPTPEPSVIVLLGVGAACVLSYVWRRRREI